MKRAESREKSMRKRILLIVLAAVLLVLIAAGTALFIYLNHILHSYTYVPLETQTYKERTTAEPSTAEPTAESTTAEPSTAEPSTEAPSEESTEEPTEEPTEETTEEPTEEPTTEEPSTEPPTIHISELVGMDLEYDPVDQPIDGYRNILILGTDARNQKIRTGGANADVMVIVSISEATGEVRLVSVLRDCVLLQETGKKLFNKANNEFARKNISTTIAMLNRNLGLDIDEFVIVNWKSVAETINAIGGIEFTIPNQKILELFNGYLTETNESTGIWAPQLKEPGTYIMSGTQAVAFCRIRGGGYDDWGRTEHQREAVAKVLEKVKSMLAAGDVAGVLRAAEIAMSGIASNLTPDQILDLAVHAADYTITETRYFPVRYVASRRLEDFYERYNINSCLMAKDFEKEVRDLHEFLFPDREYEPSETVLHISEAMRWEVEGDPEPTEEASTASESAEASTAAESTVKETVEPSTAAPSTSAPSTSAPSTSAPSTAAPSTAAPVTTEATSAPETAEASSSTAKSTE